LSDGGLIAYEARALEWQRLKVLVLDSISSPTTRGVYNLALDEFFAWYGEEHRPGFTQGSVGRLARLAPITGPGCASQGTNKKGPNIRIYDKLETNQGLRTASGPGGHADLQFDSLASDGAHRPVGLKASSGF
jgi:hypothetical protein